MFRKLVVPHYHANGKLSLTPSGTFMKGGLAEWKTLSEQERRPAIEPFSDKDHPRCAHRPPEGGAVVRTFVRALDRSSSGEYAHRTEFDKRQHIDGRGSHSTPLWITQEEVQGLAALGAKQGATVAFPPSLLRRLMRFYLVPAPYCRQIGWGENDVVRQDLKLVVEESSAAGTRVRIEGSLHLAQGANPNAHSAFQPRVLGYVAYDAEKKALTRFDLVALGSARGFANWSNEGGHSPVGIAFELAKGDSTLDRMIPLHLPGNPVEYFAPGRR